MKSRRALGLAAALCWCAVLAPGQTVVGVGQGGTGASTPAGARAKLGAAAAGHTHGVADLEGVTGKSGSGSVLLTFGGGGMGESTCAMFDGQGNLVSTGEACTAAGPQPGSTYAQTFTNATSVVMNHGMGTKQVVMACYDLEDRMVGVHSARVATANQVEVVFTTPQSGRCVVQGAGGMEITGAVASVFGRQGMVSAQSGDYTFGQIAGVAGVAQGGTNQTAWIAGRCVQVAADGSRLESAPDACGAGLGESTSVSNSGAGVQVLKTGTNVTARTLVGGSNVTITQEADTITIEAAGGTGAVEVSTGLAGNGTEEDPLRVNPALVPTFVPVTDTLNDWGTISAGVCTEKTLAFAGAVQNDAVIARWPSALPNGLTGLMRVTATNVVTVRLCNVTESGVAVPDGMTFGATILRSF
jgi:hypothetical protein